MRNIPLLHSYIHEKFCVISLKFRVNSRKIRVYLRKFRVYSLKLRVNSRKFPVYLRNFRVISRKLRVNSRKFRVISRKIHVYSRKIFFFLYENEPNRLLYSISGPWKIKSFYNVLITQLMRIFGQQFSLSRYFRLWSVSHQSDTCILPS